MQRLTVWCNWEMASGSHVWREVQCMELPIEDLSVTGIACPTQRGLQEASGRLKVLTQSTLLKKATCYWSNCFHENCVGFQASQTDISQNVKDMYQKQMLKPVWYTMLICHVGLKVCDL